MIGMLQAMLGRLYREQELEKALHPPPSPYGPVTPETFGIGVPGIGPRPFRDPAQPGPAPPVGQLTAMLPKVR